MSKLTLADVPVLLKLGFEAGWSGTTWFGTDRNGVKYQVISDEEENEVYTINCGTRQRVDLQRESLYDMFEVSE